VPVGTREENERDPALLSARHLGVHQSGSLI
jgi:hypothetical protein